MSRDNPRITSLDMSTVDIIVALAEGNPGAATVMMDCLKRGADIDPDSWARGLTALFDFDMLDIYGPRIWMLYKDVCGSNIYTLHAILRAWQLGLLQESALHNAITNRGAGLDIQSLTMQVKERLPRFKLTA